MKVWELRDDWSLDNLVLTERPDPAPGHGEVLLRMKAASLNYRDWLLIRGGYGRAAGSLPLIPISDGLGEVVAVGPGVARVAEGQRACPVLFRGWHHGGLPADGYARVLGGPLDGVMAELMVVPAADLVVVPDGMSDVGAACLPCAGLTAWSAVVDQGRVKPGEIVLVLGTGGVALFALLFAKLCGAEVIVTSSSDEKLARARALGADHGINYKEQPDWGRVARELSGRGGVDLVVETAGTLGKSLRAVRPGGRISLMGVLGNDRLEGRLSAIVMRQVSLLGITAGPRAGFEAMVRACAVAGLEPPVDRVFGFDELRPALEHLASQKHVGKVCLGF